MSCQLYSDSMPAASFFPCTPLTMDSIAVMKLNDWCALFGEHSMLQELSCIVSDSIGVRRPSKNFSCSRNLVFCIGQSALSTCRWRMHCFCRKINVSRANGVIRVASLPTCTVASSRCCRRTPIRTSALERRKAEKFRRLLLRFERISAVHYALKTPGLHGDQPATHLPRLILYTDSGIHGGATRAPQSRSCCGR